jgi:hypothetical protein
MLVVTILETVLLAVAIVFIVALLRSHADILRRLSVLEDGAPAAAPADARAAAAALSPAAAPGEQTAVAISGQTLGGDAAMIGLGAGSPPTLLAFLSSGCATCAPLWEGLRDPATSRLAERTVIVTHDTSRESPSRLARLAPPGVELLQSSTAWSDYAVPASPHFVLTDGRGGIVGRGSARSWPQLEAMLDDARSDAARAGRAPALAVHTTEARARRSEEALARAGIGPGHPSLYPGAAGVEADGDRA